jgi:hypothetical protein
MHAVEQQRTQTHVQLWPRPKLPPRPNFMRVSLAYVEQRANVWLRFGKPVREIELDHWRRVALFEPGAVCCRAKWIANDYGTVVWQLVVLQAPMPFDAQRVAGVQPGAHVLLRAEGERQVKPVLEVIDTIEKSAIDACAVAESYWRTVGNRLAARQPLPEYTAERHAAHLARRSLR